MNKKSIEKFWSRTDRSSGCWEWTGSSSAGYGNATFDGKRISSHRLAWILTYGPIPEGIYVCHHCDNAYCINPEHLFLGTAKDNAQDSVKKGRRCVKKVMRRNDKWITVAILIATRNLIKAIQEKQEKESPIGTHEELGELVDRVVRAEAILKDVKIPK
jgi:hypothetical protein